jgi:hypothetical protein
MEKRAQEETLYGFPLGIPFPLAKFADKNRLTADTFVGKAPSVEGAGTAGD